MHNFGEKSAEYSTKQSKDIPVWQSPKYMISRNKAIEIIDSNKYGLEDGDFWILMNETKTGKMAYTGLITSHNACLKINDALEAKFKPECVVVDKDGYGNSLVYTYVCPSQGIYEVGEASAKNCLNAYPYAMAYKRLFDRVVLRLSKLAYSGVYSEAEADEFRNPHREEIKPTKIDELTARTLESVLNRNNVNIDKLLASYKVSALTELTSEMYGDIIRKLNKKK